MSFYEMFTARGVVKEADVVLFWAKDNQVCVTYPNWECRE